MTHAPARSASGRYLSLSQQAEAGRKGTMKRNNDLRAWKAGDRVYLPGCDALGTVAEGTDAFGRTGVRYDDTPETVEYCHASALIAEYEVPAPYSPDCPACLRGRPHNQTEHDRKLERVYNASR